MTFAAIDWLPIIINLLLVIFVIVCFLMILLILMQRPKQEGLGAAFGGGVTDQVFGARTTNVLQRGTVYLGSMFFIISLALAILIGQQNKQKTLITPETPAAETEVETPEAPEVPVVPEGPKSLADELPAEPEAPSEMPAEIPADSTDITPPSAEEEAAPEVSAPTTPEESEPVAPADEAPAEAAPVDEEAPAEN